MKSMVIEEGVQKAYLYHGIPVGAIVPYAGFRCPLGYWWCAGGIVSSPAVGHEYEELAITIGGAYGVSDAAAFDFVSGSDTITDDLGTSNRYDVGDIVFVASAATAVYSEIGAYPEVRYHPLYVVARPTSTTYKLALDAGGTPLVADVTRTENIYSAFSFPDLRGRVIAGMDAMDDSPASRLTTATGGFGDASKFGLSGGTERHTLTSDQSGLPAHNHQIYFDAPANTPTTGAAARASNIGASGSNARLVASVAAANASQAHPNCQPTLLCGYIIRTKLKG